MKEITKTPTPTIPDAALLSAQADREKILAEYSHDDRRITQPGKFENEPVFAPHFWSVAMEGFSDSDDGRTFTFRIKRSDAEYQAWPELRQWLGRKSSLRLSEDSQGFVHCF